jgi:hypothetical protein
MQNIELKTFIEDHQRLFVLSGIPDHRDADGNWKRTQPNPECGPAAQAAGSRAVIDLHGRCEAAFGFLL